ncbi:Type IV leader peptidase family protein [Roseivivax jejudonensis]|uniref:Type IV leader peptidase family protein n=1 Tax=Roseivivax jejudonensis TaxID=1529041 RepID=A0A1X6ZBP7_9RHOB|nr:prepilin peptidase [Roseivivax jejudonensis]SLN46319.1 Type IV leader peptidase family protein [Roseivivax jejudonensis]
MPDAVCSVGGAWLTAAPLGLLLALAALSDLRWMRIPNALVLATVALFAVTHAPCLETADLVWRVAVALVIVLTGLAAFAAGLVGAGDVKFLAALSLFVPADDWVLFLFMLGVGLLLAVALTLGLRRVAADPGSHWKVLADEAGRLPAGVGLGLAGWGFLLT